RYSPQFPILICRGIVRAVDCGFIFYRATEDENNFEEMVNMKKVFVAGKIPQAGLDKLKQEFDVELYDDEKELISQAELKTRIKDKDALLSLLSTPVDKEIIDCAPNLKILANYGAGYNNIDFDYAGEKGIWVTNTPKVSTAATADLTIGL